MTFLNFDAGEMRALAVDLPNIGRKAAKVVDATLEEGARDLAATWRRNAEMTSGKSAKLYPGTIDHERVLSISALSFEVGPNPAKGGQAKLGHLLEEGSPTSPAHLNGQKAADEVVPKIERRIDSALGLLGL